MKHSLSARTDFVYFRIPPFYCVYTREHLSFLPRGECSTRVPPPTTQSTAQMGNGKSSSSSPSVGRLFVRSYHHQSAEMQTSFLLFGYVKSVALFNTVLLATADVVTIAGAVLSRVLIGGALLCYAVPMLGTFSSLSTLARCRSLT